jgi:Spy/CpxP family protein refolding chaperone
MKIRLPVLGFISGALMLLPLTVPAQQSDTMTQKPFQKMISELKLTPDQQAKLRAQHKQMREEGKVLFEQMKKVRGKVREELLKDKPSTFVLDDYAAQLAGLQKQLIQKRHEHLLKAKAILTPEQFSKLVSHEGKGFGPEGDRPLFRKKGEHGPPTDDIDDR